jgi:hypothetical protein
MTAECPNAAKLEALRARIEKLADSLEDGANYGWPGLTIQSDVARRLRDLLKDEI